MGIEMRRRIVAQTQNYKRMLAFLKIPPTGPAKSRGFGGDVSQKQDTPKNFKMLSQMQNSM